MAPPKGKQATKGAKQIVAENADTVKFYRNLSLGSSAIYITTMLAFFYDDLTGPIIVNICLCVLTFIGSHTLLTYAAKASYSENGVLLDSGTDLNMNGGVAEHVKDLVILASGTQLLSLISNYFWMLLLLAPIRVVHLLWKSVLAPWFFQEASSQPENDEKNDKKQRKLDRKMKMQRN